MKLLIIVCLLISLTFGCSKPPTGNATNTESNWEKRIVSKQERPLASLISPHVDEVNVLIIDGKRFEHVRGLKKFYVPVPKNNAILFVVDEGDKHYSVTYHIYMLDPKEDIKIPSSGFTVFGNAIGSSDPLGRNDSIEVSGDGIIMLSSVIDRSENIQKAYDYLDLSKRSVVARKQISYDKSGKIIDEHDEIPPF